MSLGVAHFGFGEEGFGFERVVARGGERGDETRDDMSQSLISLVLNISSLWKKRLQLIKKKIKP